MHSNVSAKRNWKEVVLAKDEVRAAAFKFGEARAAASARMAKRRLHIQALNRPTAQLRQPTSTKKSVEDIRTGAGSGNEAVVETTTGGISGSGASEREKVGTEIEVRSRAGTAGAGKKVGATRSDAVTTKAARASLGVRIRAGPGVFSKVLAEAEDRHNSGVRTRATDNIKSRTNDKTVVNTTSKHIINTNTRKNTITTMNTSTSNTNTSKSTITSMNSSTNINTSTSMNTSASKHNITIKNNSTGKNPSASKNPSTSVNTSASMNVSASVNTCTTSNGTSINKNADENGNIEPTYANTKSRSTTNSENRDKSDQKGAGSQSESAMRGKQRNNSNLNSSRRHSIGIVSELAQRFEKGTNFKVKKKPIPSCDVAQRRDLFEKAVEKQKCENNSDSIHSPKFQHQHEGSQPTATANVADKKRWLEMAFKKENAPPTRDEKTQDVLLKKTHNLYKQCEVDKDNPENDTITKKTLESLAAEVDKCELNEKPGSCVCEVHEVPEVQEGEVGEVGEVGEFRDDQTDSIEERSNGHSHAREEFSDDGISKYSISAEDETLSTGAVPFLQPAKEERSVENFSRQSRLTDKFANEGFPGDAIFVPQVDLEQHTEQYFSRGNSVDMRFSDDAIFESMPDAHYLREQLLRNGYYDGPRVSMDSDTVDALFLCNDVPKNETFLEQLSNSPELGVWNLSEKEAMIIHGNDTETEWTTRTVHNYHCVPEQKQVQDVDGQDHCFTLKSKESRDLSSASFHEKAFTERHLSNVPSLASTAHSSSIRPTDSMFGGDFLDYTGVQEEGTKTTNGIHVSDDFPHVGSGTKVGNFQEFASVREETIKAINGELTTQSIDPVYAESSVSDDNVQVWHQDIADDRRFPESAVVWQRPTGASFDSVASRQLMGEPFPHFGHLPTHLMTGSVSMPVTILEQDVESFSPGGSSLQKYTDESTSIVDRLYEKHCLQRPEAHGLSEMKHFQVQEFMEASRLSENNSQGMETFQMQEPPDSSPGMSATPSMTGQSSHSQPAATATTEAVTTGKKEPKFSVVIRVDASQSGDPVNSTTGEKSVAPLRDEIDEASRIKQIASSTDPLVENAVDPAAPGESLNITKEQSRILVLGTAKVAQTSSLEQKSELCSLETASESQFVTPIHEPEQRSIAEVKVDSITAAATATAAAAAAKTTTTTTERQHAPAPTAMHTTKLQESNQISNDQGEGASPSAEDEVRSVVSMIALFGSYQDLTKNKKGGDSEAAAAAAAAAAALENSSATCNSFNAALLTERFLEGADNFVSVPILSFFGCLDEIVLTPPQKSQASSGEVTSEDKNSSSVPQTADEKNEVTSQGHSRSRSGISGLSRSSPSNPCVLVRSHSTSKLDCNTPSVENTRESNHIPSSNSILTTTKPSSSRSRRSSKKKKGAITGLLKSFNSFHR